MKTHEITLDDLMKDYSAKDVKDLMGKLSSRLSYFNILADISPELYDSDDFTKLLQDSELVLAMYKSGCTKALVNKKGFKLIP